LGVQKEVHNLGTVGTRYKQKTDSLVGSMQRLGCNRFE